MLDGMPGESAGTPRVAKIVTDIRPRASLPVRLRIRNVCSIHAFIGLNRAFNANFRKLGFLSRKQNCVVPHRILRQKVSSPTERNHSCNKNGERPRPPGAKMKKMLLLAAFAAGSCLFGQVSVGINLGAPPPPRVVRVAPARPRTRLRVGRRLLVRGWRTLPMACRVLDSPTLRGSGLGRAALGRWEIL